MKISFELSTACNARCVFCALPKMTRKGGQMSDELFHKIIKEGKETGCRYFTPFIMGEPFIYKKIWDCLDYMQEQKVKVCLYTNAEFIDVERICKYKNISYLNCSLNAATSDTHAKVMRGPKWDRAKDNTDRLIEKAPFPVRISFIECDENIHEVEEFKKMYSKKRRKVRQSANWTNDVHNSLEMKGEKTPCDPLFHQMYIQWNGDVVPCCMDYNGKMVIGNANTQSIKEIWDKNEWMREKHKAGKWDEIPLCRTCNYNTKR